jgi:uncharacterized protein YjbJ (UPF0337 family)
MIRCYEKFSQQSLVMGVTNMSGKTDEVKGRIKEAAGVLIDDKNLRQVGKTDQAIGKAKQVASAQVALDKAKAATKTCGTGCD